MDIIIKHLFLTVTNLLNSILFIYLLFLTGPQGQQCYTLMGFSILYKNSLLLLLLLLHPLDLNI